MKKRSRVISDKSGFTLVELMVVISILAILALITVPSYMSWMPSYRLKGAARDMISNLQLAKLEAIKRNTTCTVNIDVGGNAYNLQLPDSTIIKTVSLGDYGSGITFTNTGNISNAITFSSRGIATFDPVPSDTMGKIFITNNKQSVTHKIQITSIGTITLPR